MKSVVPSKILIAATPVLLFVSCSREPAAPEKVEAKATLAAAKPEREPGVVVLGAQQQQQANLRMEVVESRSVPVSIEAGGRITINEDRTWTVGSVAEGRVIRVHAAPGDKVQVEQRLASMHSHDIHEVRADFRRARAELIRAQSQQAFAQKQRDRMVRLYELKAASLDQVEHADAELKNALAAVANAQTDLERHRVHIVEFLQLPVEEHEDHKPGEFDHEEDLIPVRSPATGTVIRRNVTPGSVAKTGDELFAVSDLSTVWMIAAVQEEHLGVLRAGMPVQVQTQAFRDRTFRGRITKIGEQLDPATRTIQVRVELGNPAGLLKPEMYATAVIQAGGTTSAIHISQSAIQQINGQSVVFVQRDSDHFEVRAIQTGRPMDDRIEVLQGLQGGERVVAQGSYLLKSQLLKASLAEEE